MGDHSARLNRTIPTVDEEQTFHPSETFGVNRRFLEEESLPAMKIPIIDPHRHRASVHSSSLDESMKNGAPDSRLRELVVTTKWYRRRYVYMGALRL
jgi:hypothetical protein